MMIPICLICSILLNAFLAILSSTIRHNKKLEHDAYKYLVTLQWATMLVQFFGVYLAILLFVPMIPLDRYLSSFIVIIISIYVYILFGDRIPKKIVNKHMDQLEPSLMKICFSIHKLLTPLTFFLRIQIEHKQDDISEDDIREMINSGKMEEKQREFIENIFEFDDIPVEEICTHRNDVVCLYLEDSKEEWNQTILENRHTLYPVCDKSRDDVIGILDTRDYFRLDSIEQDNVINKSMDKPFFISQNMKADVLFKEMKIRKNYFAVLLDEYGGMSGIVTLHDLMEVLLGEIQEEDEIEEPDEIQRIDENQWRIYGSAYLEDVENALSLDLPQKDYDTFGGFILGSYGKIPDDGTTFELHLDDMDIYVKEIKSHRIGQTIVQIKEKGEKNDGSFKTSD